MRGDPLSPNMLHHLVPQTSVVLHVRVQTPLNLTILLIVIHMSIGDVVYRLRWSFDDEAFMELTDCVSLAKMHQFFFPLIVIYSNRSYSTVV